MVKSSKTTAKGIRYHNDVLNALEYFAKRYFNGNVSAAQNHINRKALKIPEKVATYKKLDAI